MSGLDERKNKGFFSLHYFSFLLLLMLNFCSVSAKTHHANISLGMTGELTEELFNGFRKIESEYYKHPAKPADTRRYFDHRSIYPSSSIAALGRFKKFLNWQNIEDQGIDGQNICEPEISCDPEAKYRTFDGTCNNLQNPDKGSVNSPYIRVLSPAYGDGDILPRGVNKFNKEFGYISSLPSPRHISDVIMTQGTETKTESRKLSHMVMQWGQFIGHDMMSTAREAFDCCSPKIKNSFRCFPIDVQDEDSFFAQFGKQCLDFTRSDIHCKSSLGVGEQFNEKTSFLDASNIYGNSKGVSDVLRGGERKKEGKLWKNSKLDNFLPRREDLLLDGEHPDDIVAGDRRVQTQAGLTSMHNLFFLEHNRIAEFMYKELGSRTRMTELELDELVFQETRKLVIAEIQWITFKEFLPLVIGKSGIEQYDINLDASKYNPQTDPGIINSFATAAFRFGHSLVQSIFKGKNQPWKLGEFYGNASFATDNNGENFTNELIGLSKQPCQNADVHITDEMTHFLFCNEKTEGGGGHDIAAINIQRGRDHGIPGYQEFRRLCGLEELKSLEITPDGMDPESWSKIQSVYGSVDEIDLFVGGLAELPTQDGLIGPTFSCIIGRQFKALMEGDRFFFHHTDGPGIRPLTGSALKEIKQRSLASIICESTSISELAKHVFIQSGPDNEIEPCNQHVPLNLENILNEIIT